jgi:hypothetical protein
LAQAQIETSSGAWGSVSTAEATYAAQMEGSSVVLRASVTLASPGVVKQIADAVALVNHAGIPAEYEVDPATNNGISAYINPISVTENDAVNIPLSGGAVSATAMQGATFPNGLPSLTSIQQALNDLKTQDETIGWNGVEATPESTAKDVADAWWNASFDGSFTLVKLPPGTTGAGGANFTIFSATGDDNNKWALVLTQNAVSVTFSDTHVNA